GLDRAGRRRQFPGQEGQAGVEVGPRQLGHRAGLVDQREGRADRLFPRARHADELLANDVQRRGGGPQRLDPARPPRPRRPRAPPAARGAAPAATPPGGPPPAGGPARPPPSPPPAPPPASPIWPAGSAVRMSPPTPRLVLAPPARTPPAFSPASIVRRRCASS